MSKILKTGVVKVQLPQASNEDEPPALVYFVDRKHHFLPVTDALLNQMGGRQKRYFKAELHDDGIVIMEPVPDQFW